MDIGYPYTIHPESLIQSFTMPPISKNHKYAQKYAYCVSNFFAAFKICGENVGTALFKIKTIH